MRGGSGEIRHDLRIPAQEDPGQWNLKLPNNVRIHQVKVSRANAQVNATQIRFFASCLFGSGPPISFVNTSKLVGWVV